MLTKIIGYIPSKTSDDKYKLRKKLYNNSKWRKLREVYMMEHPLCERCLEKGITKVAEDCHHKKSPFRDGLSMIERYELLTDYDNLEALCRDCHNDEHRNKRRNKSM